MRRSRLLNAAALALLCLLPFRTAAAARGTRDEYLIRGLPAHEILGIRPLPPERPARGLPHVDGMVVTRTPAAKECDSSGGLDARVRALYEGDRARVLPEAATSGRPRHSPRGSSGRSSLAATALMLALASGSCALFFAAFAARRHGRRLPENRLSPATVSRQRGSKHAWKRTH
jgi:hypothetical protein